MNYEFRRVRYPADMVFRKALSLTIRKQNGGINPPIRKHNLHLKISSTRLIQSVSTVIRMNKLHPNCGGLDELPLNATRSGSQ